MFFGYYMSAAVMVADEDGPAVPELTRRITVGNSSHDPAAALAGVLASMPAGGVASATSSPTPATPTASPAPGQTRSAPPAPASSRTCTQTTAAPREPTTARSSPTDACTAPPPQSHYWNWYRCHPAPATDARRPRHPDRRARPAQARPAHRQRRRRLPPAGLPRGHREGPLPAPPGVHDTAPGPARDPHPAAAPTGLLHPENNHRRPRHRGENQAEARLPLEGLAALLPAAHRRRKTQRRHQRHRRQQHRPGLDPPDRHHPAHALAYLPHGRAQPAHPGHLPSPPPRHTPRRQQQQPRPRKRRREPADAATGPP